ncbi:hypothetical protein HL033_04250 [Neoehrlichia mikurensis]|uniref:Uncharacterized protein n=1 Tax=Neoehrlichia mikurensis TaxID=89586 RepID=A0A9Q9C0H8_9RICK|nr:hypothetical protein [Neoehrlichia mikurensis]QXK91927.1 hypothetical protein IAH97_04245 [Neoehrlichia mikurensis]QXK93140.1 hypothetical protein HUN61_04240 [Neoehrlichia mikurensis]QXK93620.1 hypothetical protein HL033_04250 [Neoehrlichia mikurensis]UTO55424.1 hypothetical protein LUA82_04610 [Neoehrlichia mikurensis]UTO56344.1 hypothetical protein LUA81_04560 [Neoehrlichia mikurensis]
MSSEESKGINIAAMQSALHYHEQQSGDHAEGDDATIFASISGMILHHIEQSLKGNPTDSLTANLIQACSVYSSFAGLEISLKIMSTSDKNLFGLKALFDHIRNNNAADESGGDASDYNEQYLNPHDNPELYDPHHFNEYPHADKDIMEASHGIQEMQHSPIEHDNHISPSHSPVVQHSHDNTHSI